jgi:predicted transcriptional regulator
MHGGEALGTTKRILNLIEGHGPMAVSDIAHRLQVPRRALYDPINSLRRKRRLHVARDGRQLVAATNPLTEVEATRLTPKDAAREPHAWLQEHPALDQATITWHWQERGCKRTTIQYRLRRLEAADLAQRSHHGRGAAWHAT